MEKIKLLALDAGRTTGVASGVVTKNTRYEVVMSKALDTSKECSLLIDVLQYEEPDIVIVEKFVPRPVLGLSAWSAELNGVARCWCYLNDRIFVEQPATVTERKALYTFMPKGLCAHEKDARAHLLTFIGKLLDIDILAYEKRRAIPK